MKRWNFRRNMALWVAIGMVLQLLGGTGLKIASAETLSPGSIQLMAVTSAAISYTYYIGGAGADDGNDGITTDTPFATLAKAADTISSIEKGSFQIYVQGNTIETRETNFESIYNSSITICNSVTGSAIIMRDPGYTGALIDVNDSIVAIGNMNGGNDLIFDGGSASGTEANDNLISIDSEGSLTLYANTYLQNNGTPTGMSGGGIYNRGTVNIYGGTIRGNYRQTGAGIYNYGYLYIYGGSITGNTAVNGGGITNRGMLEIHGGSIDNNTAAEGGGINNRGGRITIAEGSTISNNSASEEGGGIYNEGTIELTGGLIRDNIAPQGGAVSNLGVLYLSGSPSVPAGVDKGNDIYLLRALMIRIGFNIPAKSMAIKSAEVVEGFQIINGQTVAITEQCAALFDLLIPNYQINSKGFLEYNGPVANYYVGGTGAADNNSGITPGTPFATLSAAIIANNSAGCVITVQDDLTVTDTINVTGRVQIVSDGGKHTISGSDTLFGSLFNIEKGFLILGNNTNTDNTDLLTLTMLNKLAFSEGIIINETSKLDIYSGVVLEGLPAGAIANIGLFNLYGGIIQNCDGDSTIYNDHTINMYGGAIIGNRGVSIDNHGEFVMTGGNIADYTIGGIENYGGLRLSGDINISSTQAQAYSIYLSFGNGVIVDGILGSTKPILIDMYSYAVGTLILDGNPEIVSANAPKFTFASGDNNFNISSTGYLEYIVRTKNYYVNEELTEIGDGSLEKPFNSLSAAVDAIDKGVGNIILQSDALLQEPIIIKGTVNLLSDGEIRTVFRGNNFVPHDSSGDNEYFFDGSEDLFIIIGKLVLGNMDLSGSDNNPTLILDGGRELPVPVLKSGRLIYNEQTLMIYPGVALQNNDGTAVYNSNLMQMYGGTIRNNNAKKSISGVYNIASFEMYGGSITGNTGRVAGVMVRGTFHMDGGSINSNTGETAGVYVQHGLFTMDGGNISGNISENGEMEAVGGVLVVSGEFNMTGGSINGNEGNMTGVIIFGDNSLELFGAINSLAIAPIIIHPGIMKMSGGSISDNKGMVSGIYTYTDGIIEMLGGTIGNNDSTYSGIIAFEGDSVRLGGNPILEGNSKIYLRDTLNQGITIVSPLITQNPFMVTILSFAEEPVSEFTIGKQLLRAAAPYKFTIPDTEKFTLSDPELGVNPKGQVRYAIKDSWVSINYGGNFYYGEPKSLIITIFDELKALVKDIDFVIEYQNYYDRGTAQVIVRGIGDYAGKVTKILDLQKTAVKGILTANPANKIFKAGDNMTQEQLLASISLTHVQVETEQGTVVTLPVIWKQTGGIYNTKGGTYTYTGTLVGNSYVDVKDMALTTQIQVLAELPTGSTVINVGTGGGYIPAVISYNTNQGSFDVNVNLEDGENPSGKELVIELSTEDILDQIKITAAKQINISATLSSTRLSSGALDMTDLILTAELISAAKEAGKDITVSIYDETGRERYSWSFTAENLQNSRQEIADTNLFLDVKNASNDETLKALLEKGGNAIANSLIINFGQDGVLPSQAGVRIYVGDQPGMTEGSMVYLYHYNEEAGMLESLPIDSGYQVDKDGYITLDIVHCSTYVLLEASAGSTILSSLKDQITVGALITQLYVGGTKDVSSQLSISLPYTLEQVANLSDKTAGPAIGGVTISYRSGNKRVATVDENGLITAKNVGMANILTTVTFYNGITKTYETSIKVKKPYITLTKSTASMKVKETFTYTATAYGLEAKDIVWSTSEKSVVTINKTSGKAKAVSAGTDYVTATIGSIVEKIKVVVK